MFYPMVFLKDDFHNIIVRPIRVKPYSKLEHAKRAIEKKGVHGYIKQLGQQIPVWSNVK